MIDMVGKRCGKLTVIGFDRINKHRTAMWKCLCDCGNTSIVRGTSLRRKEILSCGCYSSDVHSSLMKKRNTKHGMSKRNGKRRVYRIWAAMLTRCNNPNFKQYKDYGGRGISVCDEWHDFENFFNDMGHPTTNRHGIDRIDNNGNYNKENCRWSLPVENSRNSRWTKLNIELAQEIRIRYKTENITHKQLAIEYGVSKGAISHVLKNRHWIDANES